MRPLFVGIILSALLTTSAFACGPNTNGVRRLPTWPLAAAIDGDQQRHLSDVLKHRAAEPACRRVFPAAFNVPNCTAVGSPCL
jgi:hypothetical protein